MNFRRIDWSAHAETSLRRALPVAEDVQVIRGEVLRGISWLWEIDDGASYMVTRAEFPDLVCVAYEGADVREMADHLLAAAERSGFKFVRFHTQRPALIRMLKDLQPEPIEYVTRIHTHGRQFKKSDGCEPVNVERTRH